MSLLSVLKKERGPSAYALFDFRISENVNYLYTDADEEVWFGGRKYTPEQITYSEMVNDGTIKRSAMQVETRNSLPPAKIFRVDPPGFVASLTVYEAMFSDKARDVRQIWGGRILNCRIERDLAKFACEPIATAIARPGLRRNYQRPCPHALYGDLCGAARVEQPVSWVSGTTDVWTVSKPAVGYLSTETYAGGLVSWRDAEGVRRFQTILDIVEIGDQLRVYVNRALAPAGTPTDVRIVKGCNHTETACRLWHNNINSFGGCPFIPDDNPVNKYSTYF